MPDIQEIANAFFTDCTVDGREPNSQSLRAWLWFTCPAELRDDAAQAITADARFVRTMGRPPIDGETRADTFRWRITPTERQQLESMAAEHGQTPSQYLRSVVFGKRLQYSAWMDYGTGPILLGTARDFQHAEAMAKDALNPDAAWVSWVIDHGTEHVSGKGEIARFAAHADAPGYNRVVEIDK